MDRLLAPRSKFPYSALIRCGLSKSRFLWLFLLRAEARGELRLPCWVLRQVDLWALLRLAAMRFCVSSIRPHYAGWGWGLECYVVETIQKESCD